MLNKTAKQQNQMQRTIQKVISKHINRYGYKAETIFLAHKKVIFFKITPDTIDDNPTIHCMVDDMNAELTERGFKPTITVDVWETEDEIIRCGEYDDYTGLRSIVGTY